MAAVKCDLRIPIESTIRGLGSAIPRGGKIYATMVLVYFHGNRNFIKAGEFVSRLQSGNLEGFEWCPSMKPHFNDVDSVLFNQPIDFFDVGESIRKLKVLLS